MEQKGQTTTLFGAHEDFAIEVGVDGIQDGRPVWGHACVWCRDISLGNLDNPYCGLAGMYEHCKEFAESINSLWDPMFEGKQDRDIWNFLDASLYGYHLDVEVKESELTAEEAAGQQDRRWWNCNILPCWGEMFDGVKAFLLMPPSKPARLIYTLDHKVLHAADVSRERVIESARDFVKWFDSGF